MKITILGPQRRRPRIGDRRVTKRHGLQIRVVSTTAAGHWMRSGSRYLYDWRSPGELAGTRWEYLLRAILPTAATPAAPAPAAA